MIDPLGPDPSDPRTPARQVGEILPDPPVPPTPSKSAGPIASEGEEHERTAAQDPRSSNAIAHARQKPTGFQRAVSIAKTVLPLVGKVLPLLEGNVVATASNLLSPSLHEVNLKPIEEAITSLQTDQRALTFHTSEHKRTLRRLEDEFNTLQEAVQKNAADQAKLVEQVARLEKRSAQFMRVTAVLLILCLLFSAALALRMANIIRF